MTNRTYTLLTGLIGVVCGFVIVRSFLFADSLTVRNDLVQGLFVGADARIVGSPTDYSYGVRQYRAGSHRVHHRLEKSRNGTHDKATQSSLTRRTWPKVAWRRFDGRRKQESA